MNTYAYVSGNPLYWVDPFGLAAAAPIPGIPGFPILIPNPAPVGSDANAILARGVGDFVKGRIEIAQLTWAIANALSDSARSYVLNENANESGESGDTESCPSSNPDDWEKIPHSRPPAYRPKGDKEPVFQGDRAGDRSHAGSRWKKWNKYRDWNRGRYRDGTYDENGSRIRD